MSKNKKQKNESMMNLAYFLNNFCICSRNLDNVITHWCTKKGFIGQENTKEKWEEILNSFLNEKENA